MDVKEKRHNENPNKPSDNELSFVAEFIGHLKYGVYVVGIALFVATIRYIYMYFSSPEDTNALVIINALNPWYWISSLITEKVPFVLTVVVMVGIFLAVIFFYKPVFRVLAKTSSVILSTALTAVLAAIILMLFRPDFLYEGTHHLKTFAGGINYAITAFYSALVLFVSIGFHNSKHADSYWLKITSVVMLSICVYVAYFYGYAAFSYFTGFAFGISVIVISLIMFGIYLAIRDSLEPGTAFKAVREKSRSTEFNDVFFGCVGLIAVIPMLVWYAWVFKNSGYNTIELICLNVDYFGNSFFGFGTQCSAIKFN